MGAPKWVPGWQDMAREGLIVLGGAILAAVVVGSVPPLRDWLKKQWGEAPKGF
jgi:hypothetical protein